MSQPEPGSVADWMRLARSDLAVAKGPLPEGALPGVSCYHAQQAAEKALKAVQVHLGLEPPYEHRIGVLLDPLRDLDIPEPVHEAIVLSKYIVESRYPGDLPESTLADAERAAKHAAAVVAWAEMVTRASA